MKALDKKTQQNLADAVDTLEKANAALEEAYNALRADIEAVYQRHAEKIGSLADDANGAAEALEGLCADIAGEIRGYMEDRSEKWLEGDKGQAYESWASAFEQIDGGSDSMSFEDWLDEPTRAIETPVVVDYTALIEQGQGLPASPDEC